MAQILTQTSSSDTAITLDPSSLATSSTFVAGRECTQIDNTSTNYMDALVYCKGLTGHASTAPTIGQLIAIYVWGAQVSLATTAIDTLVGSDGTRTLSSVSVVNSLILAATAIVTDTTAGRKFYFPMFSIARLFGKMPKFWGLFVSHNQTGALAASQASQFSFNGITYTNT